MVTLHFRTWFNIKTLLLYFRVLFRTVRRTNLLQGVPSFDIMTNKHKLKQRVLMLGNVLSILHVYIWDRPTMRRVRWANWYLFRYWLRLDTLCRHIFGHDAIVGASNICRHNGHFFRTKRKNNIFIILLRNFYFQVLLVRINKLKVLIATFNVLLLRCIIC